MKKGFFAFVMAAILMALAAFAFAGSSGGTAPAVGKVNVSLTVPKKASTSCVNVVKGSSPAITQVDVSGTTMVNWKSFNSTTGAAVVMKRSFDSYSSSYIPGSSETNLPIEANITKLNFKAYSTGGHRVCVEKN